VLKEKSTANVVLQTVRAQRSQRGNVFTADEEFNKLGRDQVLTTVNNTKKAYRATRFTAAENPRKTEGVGGFYI
jgi:hypothetical protein